MVCMKNSISAYLKHNNETQLNFAKRANVSQATISRAVNGERMDPDTALKIVMAASGEIDLRDLLYPGLSFPANKKAAEA